MAEDKDKFHKFIELAAQPLPSLQEKQRRADDYSDTQTRSRKAEGTSAKRSDKSHPPSASTDPKTLNSVGVDASFDVLELGVVNELVRKVALHS